jgi:hypothetical protein
MYPDVSLKGAVPVPEAPLSETPPVLPVLAILLVRVAMATDVLSARRKSRPWAGRRTLSQVILPH